jgi:hypothetical protein
MLPIKHFAPFQALTRDQCEEIFKEAKKLPWTHGRTKVNLAQVTWTTDNPSIMTTLKSTLPDPLQNKLSKYKIDLDPNFVTFFLLYFNGVPCQNLCLHLDPARSKVECITDHFHKMKPPQQYDALRETLAALQNGDITASCHAVGAGSKIEFLGTRLHGVWNDVESFSVGVHYPHKNGKDEYVQYYILLGAKRIVLFDCSKPLYDVVINGIMIPVTQEMCTSSSRAIELVGDALRKTLESMEL